MSRVLLSLSTVCFLSLFLLSSSAFAEDSVLVGTQNCRASSVPAGDPESDYLFFSTVGQHLVSRTDDVTVTCPLPRVAPTSSEDYPDLVQVFVYNTYWADPTIKCRVLLTNVILGTHSHTVSYGDWTYAVGASTGWQVMYVYANTITSNFYAWHLECVLQDGDKMSHIYMFVF